MATPPPPPNITIPALNLTEFISWWDVSTFGLFSYILLPLAALSVYLKTRSIGATILVLLFGSMFYPNKGLVIVFAGLGLAYLIYRALYRGS